MSKAQRMRDFALFNAFGGGTSKKTPDRKVWLSRIAVRPAEYRLAFENLSFHCFCAKRKIQISCWCEKK